MHSFGRVVIIALLIAVYPANIYHAVSGGIDHPALPAAMADPTVAYLRLPFQFVFIAWAWWFARSPPLNVAGIKPPPRRAPRT